MRLTKVIEMDVDVVITLMSVQTALIIFLLERVFTLKKCISSLGERIARIEETLKILDK